jgi:galactofuranosylgalactofuranosylrhamnosyl-N-acetylglucosaminyl-diphospho-decaprenol beta-1,5/1,6-galactofuranosyltransferase
MTAPLHILQSVLPPLPDAPEGLYWHAAGPQGAPLDPRAEWPAGARLSLDSWANALPLAWHKAHCGLAEAALRLAAGPPCRVTLHDWAAPRGRRALAEGRLAPGDALALPPQAEGRVWAELTLETPGPAPALDWVTPEPPRRAPTLSIGLVTLGAEPGLADLLAGLETAAAETPELRRVFLVHQGEADLPRAAASALPGRLCVIRQPNLGGAGGFARGLAEALALDPAPSHHLMMDDDIRLDPRLLRRALDWLARTTQETALGGAMLDALAPARAWECGGRLTPSGIVRPVAQGADLARPAGDDPGDAPPRGCSILARPGAADYNAWWFCAVPLAAARRAGLPLPLFLRGDDIDYGRRLAEHGAPTLTPPGLWVWHEPFYAKATSWQHYYGLRNHLLHAAAHPQARPAATLDLLERLLTPALAQDYATARWRLLAVRHFLQGPRGVLDAPADALHRAVVSHAKPLAPEPLDRAPAGLPRLSPGPRPKRAAAQAAGLARALLQLALPQARGAPRALVPEAEAAPGRLPRAPHIREGRGGTWLRLHRPRRGLALRLTAEALWAAARYAALGARARRRWRPALERARAPAAWAARFSGAPE